MWPAGPQAGSIHQLWQLMFWVSAVVFVAVVVCLIGAVVRPAPPEGLTGARHERRLTMGVAAAGGASLLTLLVLLSASVWTGRAVARLHATSAVTIAVTGHQWWWEIAYETGVAQDRVIAANEIHIPVGRPVVLKVTSRDVIHSIWIPNLHGKRDLIPGYTTAIWMQADTPGVYRGQCAEFCGLQHAHMALTVTAESLDAFERWLNQQHNPAPEPATSIAQRGRDVFMAARCAGCHTIAGTDARGQVAPDLTHLASRPTIGAGTLPNTPDQLKAWIRNPQAAKPGNQMPPNPMDEGDLAALVAYLETLR